MPGHFLKLPQAIPGIPAGDNPFAAQYHDFLLFAEYLNWELANGQPAATSATPAQTSTTPAHRAALTCSPRMYLAPSVPTT